jgi:hypothetical protein
MEAITRPLTAAGDAGVDARANHSCESRLVMLLPDVEEMTLHRSDILDVLILTC